MPHTWVGWIGEAIYVVVCGFVLIRGGRPQRLAALVVLISSLLAVLVQDRVDYRDPGMRMLWVDGGAMVGLALIARRWPRRWLAAAIATELLTVIAHLMIYFDVSVHARAWLTLELVLGDVLLAALLAGTFTRRREVD